MVWIHGGGFKFGDSSEMIYGPDYLLSKDIVYVSMNYRLGVLGELHILLIEIHPVHLEIRYNHSLLLKDF